MKLLCGAVLATFLASPLETAAQGTKAPSAGTKAPGTTKTPSSTKAPSLPKACKVRERRHTYRRTLRSKDDKECNCSEFHGNPSVCATIEGCKVCEPNSGMYSFCIAEEATCCETSASAAGFVPGAPFDVNTCPEQNGSGHTAPIYPAAYDPTIHTNIDPDNGCFYCAGVCMTGVCCEPIADQNTCNNLDKCVWDSACQGGKCIAQGMSCPASTCSMIMDPYSCLSTTGCSWTGSMCVP